MGTDTHHVRSTRPRDEYDQQVADWQRERTTTIVLEENTDGTWHATQRGVDVHGYGETAAAAAAAYCRRIDGDA